MASFHEKGSDHDESNAPANSGYVLDNRRRAALAEVDNAKFSYVISFSFRAHLMLLLKGGSTPKSALSPV